MGLEREVDEERGFINFTAIVGGLSFLAGLKADDYSMKVIGALFLIPAVVKYSSKLVGYFCDSYLSGRKEKR